MVIHRRWEVWIRPNRHRPEVTRSVIDIEAKVGHVILALTDLNATVARVMVEKFPADHGKDEVAREEHIRLDLQGFPVISDSIMIKEGVLQDDLEVKGGEPAG